MAKKLIAVVGATGAQGSGLIRAIHSDKKSGYSVRALTRKPDGEKAQALEKLGAEVVEANLDDVGSLRSAFEGAYGAYCMTAFWEHFSPEKELAQARAMAQAAKDTGLKHVVWSTLEDTRRWVPLHDKRMPTLQNKYKVPHFDAKGEANKFFSDLKVPTTFFLTSFYWDNFIHFGMGPKKGPDGKLAITFPMADKKLPGIAVEDIGRCALGVFKKGEDLINKTVGVAGEHLSGAQMAEALSEAMGQEVVYNSITPEAYRGLGFPGAEDLGNMFQFNRDFEKQFCGARDVGFARKLNPQLQTFAQWMETIKDRIPSG